MMEITPPNHLTEKSQRIWRNLVPRRVDHPETLTLLTSALESLDQADACREQIEVEGLTVKPLTGGMPHAHPLLAVEKAARATFMRAWSAMNLHWIPYNCEIRDLDDRDDDLDDDEEGEV